MIQAFLIASRICVAGANALSRILKKAWKEEPFDPRPLMKNLSGRMAPGEERFRFVVFGDTELEPESQPLFDFAEQLHPDFIVHLGDIVDRGADILTMDWDRLAKRHGRLFRRIPFWPVIGNHEIRGNLKWANGSRFKQFFGLDKDYYSFDCGRFRFIILSWSFTEQIMNGEASQSTEIDWLREELDSSTGKEVILCLHRSIHTVGRNIPPVRELENLCRQYGIRLVFGGHDHVYYRTCRDGVTYITSGMGGNRLHPLYGVGKTIEEDVYLGRKLQSEQLVWRKTGQKTEEPFPSESHGLVEAVVEDNRLTVRALSLSGIEIDRFVLDLSDSEEKQADVLEPLYSGVTTP